MKYNYFISFYRIFNNTSGYDSTVIEREELIQTGQDLIDVTEKLKKEFGVELVKIISLQLLKTESHH